MRTSRMVPVLVALTAAAACNEVPVRDLTSSYQVQVQEIRDKGKPAKLDILWVIDDSPSMCQEQQNLAQSFTKFLQVFQRYTAIDMQLAVTTTNVCPRTQDKNAPRGRFVYTPAKEFPLPCRETRVRACSRDEDCQNDPTLPDAKNWICDFNTSGTTGLQDMYTCDLPPQVQQQSGATDKYPGDVLFTLKATCHYKCGPTCKVDADCPDGGHCLDGTCDPTQCARVFGPPNSCLGDTAGSMCAGGACSAEACQASGDLTVSSNCANLCRGRECVDVCVEVTGNQSKCEADCAAAGGDCLGVCGSAVKAPNCSNVCRTNWECQDLCEEYLHDAGRCEQICGAGTPLQCEQTCLDANHFPKQPFLCYLACQQVEECSDRCLAEFGNPAYRCVNPGSGASSTGCILPPPTQVCPATFANPPILNLQVADNYAKEWIQGKWTGDPDWVRQNPSWKDLTLEGSPDDRLDSTDPAEAARAKSWNDRDPLRARVFEQLFKCMATVGAQQAICGNQEQGLRAAYLALDRTGENAEQAKSFLRDGAYLLIIMVADEDDCSSYADTIVDPKDGKTKFSVIPDDFQWCSCLVDEDGCLPSEVLTREKCDQTRCLTGGKFDPQKCPLRSTTTIANLLKTLKPDPSQVLFAAIAAAPVVNGGPSAKDATVAQLRSRYFDCKCDRKAPRTAPYVYGCQSASGTGDVGIRYLAVADQFGLVENPAADQPQFGQFANICSDTGLEPALESIAQTVVPILTQVCLPRPMESACIQKCQAEFLEQDITKCTEICQASNCVDTCKESFPAPACKTVCAAGEFIDVFKFDGKGQCYTPDEGGNCLPLVMGQDYKLILGAPACPQFDATKGQRLENAIQFIAPLEFLDRLQIVYRSEPFYGTGTTEEDCGAEGCGDAAQP